jgi:alkylhydroperoxidase family enzyme
MRIKGVFGPGDYPGPPEEAAELFATLFPGVENPAFDRNHSGMAIVARNPKVALNLSLLSRSLILDAAWSKRADLREIAIQTVNLHYRSDFSFQARLPNARAAGLSEALLAALPDWQASPLFGTDQRLVIAYVHAVVNGAVPADLFAELVAAFGETEAIECTTVIAIWSAWAMILNAAGAEV